MATRLEGGVDYGIAECPRCQGTLFFKVLEWVSGYNWEYGGMEWDAVLDEPFCRNNCHLTKDDLDGILVEEYIKET